MKRMIAATIIFLSLIPTIAQAGFTADATSSMVVFNENDTADKILDSLLRDVILKGNKDIFEIAFAQDRVVIPEGKLPNVKLNINGKSATLKMYQIETDCGKGNSFRQFCGHIYQLRTLGNSIRLAKSFINQGLQYKMHFTQQVPDTGGYINFDVFFNVEVNENPFSF